MSNDSKKGSSTLSKKITSKGVFANKKLLIVGGVIFALVLAGSSVAIATVAVSNAKAAEEFAALSKDCEKVRSNLQGLSDWPAVLAPLENATDGFIATNLGIESRANYKAKIMEAFPDLQVAALPNYAQDEQREKSGVLTYLARTITAADGTRFQYDFSQSDIATLVTGGYGAMGAFEGEVLGSRYGLVTIETLCTGVDMKEGRGNFESDNKEETTKELLTHWDDNAMAIVGILNTINDCQEDGLWANIPCAAGNYDPSQHSYDYGTPALRDPFLNPYSSKSSQSLAVVSWCINVLGLKPNKDLTGCE